MQTLDGLPDQTCFTDDDMSELKEREMATTHVLCESYDTVLLCSWSSKLCKTWSGIRTSYEFARQCTSPLPQSKACDTALKWALEWHGH